MNNEIVSQFQLFCSPPHSITFLRCFRVSVRMCVCVLVVLCYSFFCFAFAFFWRFFFCFKYFFLFLYTRIHNQKKSFPSFSERRTFVPAILLLSLQFSYTLPIAIAHHEFHTDSFLHSDSGLLQSIRPYNNYAIWTNPCYILLLIRLERF